MPIEIDAFRVLKSINDNPEVFSGIRSEIAKAVGKLNVEVRKRVASEIKSCRELDAIRQLRKALGSEAFYLIVEGMKDTEVKSLVKKVDPHHPNQKLESGAWQRRHLAALLDASIQPADKPVRVRTGRRVAASKGTRTAARSNSAKSSKKAGEFLENMSAGLTWDPKKR